MGNIIPKKTIGAYTVYERKPKPIGVSKYVVFKGEEQVQDFRRYATAVYWCKSQSPREVPRIVIILEGGLVQGVLSTAPCDYTVIDHDGGEEEPDGERNFAIPYRDSVASKAMLGTTSEVCHASTDNATVDPDRIEAILNAINKPQTEKV